MPAVTTTPNVSGWRAAGGASYSVQVRHWRRVQVP